MSQVSKEEHELLRKQELVYKYAKFAKSIGELVGRKNFAYGDAFGQAGKVLQILYTNGVGPDQYTDMLTVVRVLDKLFRVASKKDAFGESPWTDVCGYAILAAERDSKEAVKNEEVVS